MKTLLALFLLIIILIMGSIAVLYISFNFSPPDNVLNQKFRPLIRKDIYLRKLFKLHQIGDARSDLVSNTNLEITVYSATGNGLDDNIKNQLIDKIGGIVNKPAGISIKEDTIDDIDNITDEGIISLIDTHRINLSDSAKVQIFLVHSYGPVPSYAGLVKDAYNIFIFEDAVNNISHFEKTADGAVVSTILHEFAHLLGANHVSQDGCILSAKVEDLSMGIPQKITTDFCPADLTEIHRASSL